MCINPSIRAHLDLIGELTKFLTHKKSKDFALLSVDDYVDAIIDYTTPITDFSKARLSQKWKPRLHGNLAKVVLRRRAFSSAFDCRQAPRVRFG